MYRFALVATSLAAMTLLQGCSEKSNATTRPMPTTSLRNAGEDGVTYMFPAEGSPHESTWMAYGATVSAWGDDTSTRASADMANSRDVARADLMRIAAALSRFERVNMIVANADDEAHARDELDYIKAGTDAKDKIAADSTVAPDGSGNMLVSGELPPIETFPINFYIKDVNDLWARDTAPVFVRSSDGSLAGVNFNFNGWGQEQVTTGLEGWTKDPNKAENGVEDQEISGDRGVAKYILDQVGAPEVTTWLTAEGGSIEANGWGLAVMCESSVVNDNRNPGASKQEIDAEFERVLGLGRIIWIPGLKAVEVTDGHIDFYARFVSPSHIVHAFDAEYGPDQANLAALQAGVDEVNTLSPAERVALMGTDGPLVMSTLPVPDISAVRAVVRARNDDIATRSFAAFEDSFAAGYIGYYEANGVIVMAQFGDSASDLAAFQKMQALFPSRIIISITTDGVANGGGTIHCATQQQPAL